MNISDQPGYTKPEAQRGLGLQLLIAFIFGSSSLLSFSICRRRLPKIYAARAFRKPDLPSLSPSLFGWVSDVIRLNDRDILRFAGLDAYVYLMFYRMAITLLWKLSLVSLFFIAPLRWFYLGQIDDDYQTSSILSNSDGSNHSNLFGDYIWVNVASTYIFTLICLKTMRQYTNEVISVRQAYLGHQNTITDRTLRISGIPKKLRSEDSLSQYFTTLFGREPESIIVCRNWQKLDNLFKKREDIIGRLEHLWAMYIGPENSVISSNSHPFRNVASSPEYMPGFDNNEPDTQDSMLLTELSSTNNPHSDDIENGGIRAIASQLFPHCQRPMGRIKYCGLGGPKVDLLDYYERQLAGLDMKIRMEREKADKQTLTNMAFVTLKTVAQTQLAAQVIFSPKAHSMANYLAPAPNDIIWENVYLSSKHRSIRNYIISLVVLITNLFLIIPLTYLARFLDIDIIRNHFPTLGNWLAERKWMEAFVTDVLSTYVFSLFNLVVPYFFAWLSKRQGFISRSDVELSTISKNFFFVFTNLFLIFTIESTFYPFSVDKMAKDFADWLIRLSSFYTNLIVLQGIGLTPFKLLQPGLVFQFPFLANKCQSARDFYELYKPQKINYGLVLPTPMLIFIVALTYSILRRRILLFGLLYFAASYFVFKYQLIYTLVHPQHSNGQLWTGIVRKVYLGIGMFHLAMVGVLVLQSEYQFAALILPLSLLLLGFWYDFERGVKSLLKFIAVEALLQQEIDQYHLGTYDSPSSSASSSTGVDPEERNNTSETGHTSNSRRQHRPSIIDRAEAIASLNLNQEAADLSHRLWESNDQTDKTLDEVRESNLEYSNKSLSAPLDGPWVATDAYNCIIANADGFKSRPISQAAWL